MPYTTETHNHDAAFALALLELVNSLTCYYRGYRLHEIRLADWPRACFDSCMMVIWSYKRVLSLANHELPNSLSPAAHKCVREAESQLGEAEFCKPEMEEVVATTLELLEHVRGDFLVVAATARDRLVYGAGEVEDLTKRAVEYECYAATMEDWMVNVREVMVLDPIDEADGLDGVDEYDGSESEYSQEGVLDQLDDLPPFVEIEEEDTKVERMDNLLDLEGKVKS